MNNKKGKFRIGMAIILTVVLFSNVFSAGNVSRASSLSRPTVTVKKRTKKTAAIQITSGSSVNCYRIYMKVGKTGKFKLIDFVMRTSAFRTCTYHLKKLKAGKTYYVKVRSTRTIRGRGIPKSKFSKVKKINPYKKESTVPVTTPAPTPAPTTVPVEEPVVSPVPETTPSETMAAPTEVPSETPVPVTTPAPTAAPANNANDYINEVLRLVNIERSNAGLSAYTLDDTLCQAANIRAKEIVTLFDHTRPDGTRCFTVLDELGYSYMACGENIAEGQSTPAVVVNSWMNSAGHRANILNASFHKLGVGYFQTSAGYRYYWVQLFSD